MDDLEELSDKLENLILSNSKGSMTFCPNEVEELWISLNTNVDFKTVMTSLFAQNRIGMLAKNLFEIRDPDRTD